MFTGIIAAMGSLTSRQRLHQDERMLIQSDTLDFTDVKLGDSIAVNGVCLTVVEISAQQFAADVSVETLSCTTLQQVRQGDGLNLEKALRLQDRLGGHLVSGHVDGIGHITAIADEGRSKKFTFRLPQSLSRYVAAKGSICIDGISLTVNQIQGDEFTVNIVPHTLQQTNLGQRAVTQAVNLEVDLLARYLERLMHGESPQVTPQLLKNSGFSRSSIP